MNFTNFVIEDNIPLPTTGSGYNEALRQLDVGQSFFAPGKNVVSASAAPRTLKNRKEIAASNRYTFRTVTENGLVGVRCWRLA